MGVKDMAQYIAKAQTAGLVRSSETTVSLSNTPLLVDDPAFQALIYFLRSTESLKGSQGISRGQIETEVGAVLYRHSGEANMDAYIALSKKLGIVTEVQGTKKSIRLCPAWRTA